MNTEILHQYIGKYKSNFEDINQDEIYKWQAVQTFQEHWDLGAENFYAMLEKSLKDCKNLLDSNNYYARGMLLENAKVSPGLIRGLFKDLYSEEEDILRRVEKFRRGFKIISRSNFPKKKSLYQDHRAVMVYLNLKYPDRYYFYKYNMFKVFAEKVDASYVPKIGRIQNLAHFKAICDEVRNVIEADEELKSLHYGRFTDESRNYPNDDLHILTQDLIYAIVRHLDDVEVSRTKAISIGKVSTAVNLSNVGLDPDEDFTGRVINHIQNNKENKRIGDLGELWVMEYEKKKLEENGLSHKINEIVHVSREEGDGTGYDIKSFDENGDEILIEVKTTTGPISNAFFISRRELRRSESDEHKYRLYRVYNYSESEKKADLMIKTGRLTDFCNFPVSFKAKLY